MTDLKGVSTPTVCLLCSWSWWWFLRAEEGESVFFWDTLHLSKWRNRVSLSSQLQQSRSDRVHTTSGPHQTLLAAVARTPLEEDLGTAVLVRGNTPNLSHPVGDISDNGWAPDSCADGRSVAHCFALAMIFFFLYADFIFRPGSSIHVFPQSMLMKYSSTRSYILLPAVLIPCWLSCANPALLAPNAFRHGCLKC